MKISLKSKLLLGGVINMAKKENKKKRQQARENAPGTGDKKLDGPNRPST